MPKQKHRESGFTLLEVVIAMAIFGLAVTALVGLLGVGVRGTDVVSQRHTALQVARSQVESIKNQTYAEPIAYATITPPNEGFQIAIDGTVLQPGFLEQVRVSVTYAEGNSGIGRTELTAYKVNHFPPILADKPLPPPAPPCPTGAECFTFHLHNNPSPPTGNTNAQANLPMDTTSKFSFQQFNYDANRNTDPGLTISRGGSGAGETDLTKYQNWRSSAFTGSFHIKGVVEVHIWSASANFFLNRKGEIKVFLRNFNGTTYQEIANATLFQLDWQAGFTNFVLAEVEIPSVDYTIPAGNQLEVKVIVGANSQTATMFFDYDFVDFESRVYIPTVSP